VVVSCNQGWRTVLGESRRDEARCDVRALGVETGERLVE
jgi:hypothetical protein